MQNSSVCVDASLIVRFLVAGQFSHEARILLEGWRQTGILLLSPTLFEYEVTATLRRMVYQKALSSLEGDMAFAVFESLTIHILSDEFLQRRAWHLAKHFNQPRTYDMAYVALAELSQCPFWTADERQYNSVRHELGWVHWLGTTAQLSKNP